MSNQGRALISALNSGDYQAVDQYRDLSDLDIKIVNHHVHELFERAIRMENFKLFRALLKIPMVKVSGGEYCALRHATSTGLVEYVSELARIPGINPNLRGKNGDTALLAAVKGKWTQKKALDLVRSILMTGNARTNVKGGDGRTALHYALEKTWYDVANALVDAGAHPKIDDDNGTSPLFMGMKADKIPLDLFQKMLSVSTDPPSELADEANQPDILAADDDSQDSPSAPGVIVVKGVVPVDSTAGSQKTSSVALDLGQIDPPIKADPNGKAVKRPADLADLSTVMDGQPVDDSLEKNHLFSSKAAESWRIHRKAVLEKIESVAETLQRNGETLTTEDCAKRDPVSGLNLWQSAAVHGALPKLLRGMAKSGRWPLASELSARTEDGRLLADFLEENAHLLETLNDPIWNQRPKLLASLVAQLPERRQKSLAVLVSKINLLILNGGK